MFKGGLSPFILGNQIPITEEAGDAMFTEAGSDLPNSGL